MIHPDLVLNMYSLWLQWDVLSVADMAVIVVPCRHLIPEPRRSNRQEGSIFCLVDGVHFWPARILFLEREPCALLGITVGVARSAPASTVSQRSRAFREGHWNEFPYERAHSRQACTDER